MQMEDQHLKQPQKQQHQQQQYQQHNVPEQTVCKAAMTLSTVSPACRINTTRTVVLIRHADFLLFFSTVVIVGVLYSTEIIQLPIIGSFVHTNTTIVTKSNDVTINNYYDCIQYGCWLDIHITKEVCGMDGYRYMNECIAHCQGVSIDIDTSSDHCRNERDDVDSNSRYNQRQTHRRRTQRRLQHLQQRQQQQQPLLSLSNEDVEESLRYFEMVTTGFRTISRDNLHDKQQEQQQHQLTYNRIRRFLLEVDTDGETVINSDAQNNNVISMNVMNRFNDESFRLVGVYDRELSSGQRLLQRRKINLTTKKTRSADTNQRRTEQKQELSYQSNTHAAIRFTQEGFLYISDGADIHASQNNNNNINPDDYVDNSKQRENNLHQSHPRRRKRRTNVNNLLMPYDDSNITVPLSMPPATVSPITKTPATVSPTTKAPATILPTTMAPATSIPFSSHPSYRPTSKPTKTIPTTTPTFISTSKKMKMHKNPKSKAPTSAPTDSPQRRGVIGKDDRFRTQNTTINPGKLVASLSYSDCIDCCSGSVVGVDAVLTAGHCVIDTAENFYAFRNATPGRNGVGTAPFGAWSWDYITVFRIFKDENLAEFDMAIITFKTNEQNQSIGTITGTATLGLPTNIVDSNLQNSIIIGYPSDKSSQQWYSFNCRFKLVSPISISYVGHKCDTYGGMSGSPILDINTNTVYGIHTSGYVEDEGSQSQYYNIGLVFMNGTDLYRYIRQWAGITRWDKKSCTCLFFWQIFCRLKHRCYGESIHFQGKPP